MLIVLKDPITSAVVLASQLIYLIQSNESVLFYILSKRIIACIARPTNKFIANQKAIKTTTQIQCELE